MVKINYSIYTSLVIFLLLSSHELFSGHGEKIKTDGVHDLPLDKNVVYLFKAQHCNFFSFDCGLGLRFTSEEKREIIKEQFLTLLSKKYLTAEEELECKQLKKYLEEN